MGMKRTLEVINALEAERVIGRYAIAGAVAAYNYIEPTVTEDPRHRADPAIETDDLCDLFERHGLQEPWRQFCLRVQIANPCQMTSSS